MKRRLSVAFLLLIGTFTYALAANRQVEGVVISSEDNLPLIGASVYVTADDLKKVGNNQSTIGVITNIDGQFSISIPEGVTRFYCSYVGYDVLEVKLIPGKNKYDITLQPSAHMLDAVVVTGYQTVERRKLTAAVSKIDISDQMMGATKSIDQALAGQIAGLSVSNISGTPGAPAKIRIRGTSSLNGTQDPLWVLDGIPLEGTNIPNMEVLKDIDNIGQTAIAGLNPADIDNITVLKDAAATAIYGARAANGVVMITTKSGKSGRPTVTYNGSASYRKITKKLDLLSPYEFVKLQGEINEKYPDTYYKEGNDDNGIPYRYQSLEDYIGQSGVDWQDETFNPTWSQDHNLSITGGDEKTTYSLLFTRYNENGIFNNSGFDRTTAKFRLKQKLTKKISFDATINYAQTNRKGIGTTADSGRFNMLAQILSARPTGGLKLTDEELLASAIDPVMLEDGSSLAQVNPVKQTESVTNKKRAEMWSANVSLTWEIIKGLTFRTAATYNTTNNRIDKFYKEGSKEAFRNGQKPYGDTQMGRDLRWTNSNQLTWKQKINKKNSYDIMLGHEISYRSNEYLLGQAMDFPVDYLGNNNLGLGATPSKVVTDFGDKKLLSFFARGNYNYDNRYLLTATVRADGSTVFSKKNKWGFFPSFSAAWRVSEEAFMKDVDWVSNFKVRLGWGIVGNDRISNYLSMDLYEASKYGVGNNTVTVLTPKQLKNANLKWEGSSTINLGVDLGFLDNRLNVTADFFVKNTKDLLLAQSLAHVTGFDSQMQNIGKIQNKGIELSLNSTNIQTRDFSWQTNFNISFIKNTLKGLASGVESMYARSGFDSNFTAYDYIATVGQSLGLIYGYEFDGVYQSSDFYTTPDNQLILKEGVTNNARYGTVKPGVVKYKDQDGDGIITTNDRTVIGNAMPKWFGGITNTFDYKGIDFSFMLQFNYGNDIYNATRLYSTQSRNGRRNMLAEVADRWSPTNTSNLVPSQDGYIVNDVYSRFIEDGSFLRLKNVTLGYTLPHKWTRKFHVSRLRLYATGQNLFCVSGYSGYDPEVNSASNTPMTPGLDWGAYPKSRVFTFGIDLQF